MKFLNILFFICFQILRCIKKISLKPILNINFLFNPLEGKSLYRINPDLNGYNAFVEDKYKYLLKNNFSEYYDEELFERLFPESKNPSNPVFTDGKFFIKENLPDENSALKLEKLFEKYG